MLYRAVLLPQAASFRLSHEKVFAPLVALAVLIQNNPQLASVRKSFPKVAEQLLSSVSEWGAAVGVCPRKRSVLQEPSVKASSPGHAVQ
jgi:hypothetical protein